MEPRSPLLPLPDAEDSAPALWLVRHGESTWNVAGLGQGQQRRGRADRAAALRQAAEAAGAVPRTVRSARSTPATCAARGRPPPPSPRCSACPSSPTPGCGSGRLGVLEGAPSTDASTSSVTGLDGGLVIDPDARPAAGESVRDLYQRAAAFCDDLGDYASVTAAIRARAAASPGSPTRGTCWSSRTGARYASSTAYLQGVPVDEMTWRPVENATIVRIPDFLAAAALRAAHSRSPLHQPPLRQPPLDQSQGGTR